MLLPKLWWFVCRIPCYQSRKTMAVCEVSRTALKEHWDTQYPQAQIEDDDDNAMELKFLWALTTLWQDINQLSHRLDLDECCPICPATLQIAPKGEDSPLDVKYMGQQFEGILRSFSSIS